jgi:hypothetical protein
MQKMLWVLVAALRRESPSFLELDLYFSDKMEARIDWINSQAAVNETALAAGDGCHHEEAKLSPTISLATYSCKKPQKES